MRWLWPRPATCQVPVDVAVVGVGLDGELPAQYVRQRLRDAGGGIEALLEPGDAEVVASLLSGTRRRRPPCSRRQLPGRGVSVRDVCGFCEIDHEQAKAAALVAGPRRPVDVEVIEERVAAPGRPAPGGVRTS